MTLIELLGAIIILSIIIALAFPILLSGINTSNDIQKETMLRDEADYLMATIIKGLYTTKESEIKARYFPDKGTSNYFIEKKNGDKIGFIDGKLRVGREVIELNNNAITLCIAKIIDYEEDILEEAEGCSSISQSPLEEPDLDNLNYMQDGEYKIILSLRYTGRFPIDRLFVNVVRTINDEIKEGEEEDKN